MSYAVSPPPSETNLDSIPLAEKQRQGDDYRIDPKDSKDARFLPGRLSEDGASLPTPVTSNHNNPSNSNANKTPTINICGTKIKPTAATIIPIWIILSSSVIIYNNYLYNTLEFKFPVFLVSWHLVFATIGTRVLARTTHLLDAAKETKVSREVYIRSILPIAMLFCGSLILSNKAYLYLSVSFIQMLKASASPSLEVSQLTLLRTGF